MSEEDFLWARICLNFVMGGGDLFASEGKLLAWSLLASCVKLMI